MQWADRAAEKLVFNSFTTGAGNDIERATNLARKMVCEWGMSEKLGPLAYGKNEEELFLGREVTKHNEYSEKTAQAIDDEIRAIVTKGMERAEKILEENIDELHKLSAELLEREILDAEEISKILQGEELPPAKRNGNGEQPDEEVPDHVKKMIDEKKSRAELDKNTEKGNDSN
jgi:cell division protease FtsH